MEKDQIIMLCVGLAFLGLGVALTREPVARWGVTHGRGRVWAALFGEERAVKITRYFFAPVVVLLGAATLLGAVVHR